MRLGSLHPAAGPLTLPHEAADLFTRLAPVLNVRDPAAERAFYEKLGLPVIYEGPEYPVFRRSKAQRAPHEHVLASRRALAALRLRHSGREKCG